MDTFNRKDRLTIARFAMSAQCTRFVAGEFFLNDSGLTLSPKDKSKINQNFLDYQCLAMNDIFYSLAKGSAQKNLDVPAFRKLKLNIPKSLELQQKIVEKLDAIFAEIDKATAATKANAKNALDLYSSAVNLIFEKFTQKSIKLSACSDVSYGYTAKSSNDYSGPQYLRITDIQDDLVDWLLVPKIEENNDDLKKFLLKDGDIVFARTGATTGKSFLVKEPPHAVFASYLIRVDANREIVEPEFLRHFFKSKSYWNLINAGISGAAQGGFNASKLGELTFPLPEKKNQKMAISKLDKIESYSRLARKAQEDKSKQLDNLKQSILKQAFNGELVKE